MSQNKWYRGTDQFVVCQRSDGNRLCYGPCRTSGAGMVAGRASSIYECTKGHRFALTDVRHVKGPHAFSLRGELDGDVSGESGRPIEQPISGESGESHVGDRRIQSSYTDYRKVTQIASERPVFGSR
jgi:hypothetical protein